MTRSSTGPSRKEMFIARDAVEMARLGAELLARAIAEAIDARGVARVALSGGSTPLGAYAELATYDLAWDSVDWFWVDERAVPPDHPRSNYGAARRALSAASIPEARVHRMEAEAPDLAAAAARYEALLRATFGVASAVAFDAMTLGIGDDGHTASLFPHTGAALIADRLVAAIPAEQTPGLEARLTFTAPVIQQARLALMIVRGESKRGPVEAARRPGSEDEVPARIAGQVKGHLIWLLDDAASGHR